VRLLAKTPYSRWDTQLHDSQVFKPLGHYQPNNKREQVARICLQPQRQGDMNEKYEEQGLQVCNSVGEANTTLLKNGVFQNTPGALCSPGY